MPNNCSTMIKRRKDLMSHFLRSNSDGKLQDDIIETTAELRVSGPRKSSDHLSPSNAYRPYLPQNNRFHPASNDSYDAHLPTIRYTKGHVDQHNRSHEDFHTRTRPKTPLANASPKSNGYTPSASISSIFNAFGKRSTDNLMSSHGDFEEITSASPVPLSRRSQRASQRNGFTHNLTQSQKQLTDSGVDFRFSSSSGDTNQLQRTLKVPTRLRAQPSHECADTSRDHEVRPREKSNVGQLYQRRANHSVKAPMKQKIDKYRRRSGEIIQAAYGYPSVHSPSNGLSNPHSLPASRPKPPPPTPTPSHRIASNADIHTRLNALRASTNPTLPQTPEQAQHVSSSKPHSQTRLKSPHLYTSPQQIVSVLPTSNPPTPLVRFRRHPAPAQPPSQVSPAQPLPQPPVLTLQHQHAHQQPANYSPRNRYLAFLASQHISTLEDTYAETDVDRQKLIRIFTWIENVQQHRYEQADHEKLLLAQKKSLEDSEDNFSLYSEIRLAVDDLPANTSGKPCEKIAPMDFEN